MMIGEQYHFHDRVSVKASVYSSVFMARKIVLRYFQAHETETR